MDIDAQDLILRLMELDPRDRIGAGDKGAPNSLVNLKGHEFFKNRKFSKIHRKKPPVSKRLVKMMNKEFARQESEDDGNVKEIIDEKPPKPTRPSKVTNTFTAVDKRSYLLTQDRRGKADAGPKISNSFV